LTHPCLCRFSSRQAGIPVMGDSPKEFAVKIGIHYFYRQIILTKKIKE